MNRGRLLAPLLAMAGMRAGPAGSAAPIPSGGGASPRARGERKGRKPWQLVSDHTPSGHPIAGWLKFPGQPMTVTMLLQDAWPSADVAWHAGGNLLQTARFPVKSLRPCTSVWLHPDVAHNQAVELAEAGATKVTVSGSPVILIFGIVAGLLLAAAWGAA